MQLKVHQQLTWSFREHINQSLATSKIFVFFFYRGNETSWRTPTRILYFDQHDRSIILILRTVSHIFVMPSLMRCIILRITSFLQLERFRRSNVEQVAIPVHRIFLAIVELHAVVVDHCLQDIRVFVIADDLVLSMTASRIKSNHSTIRTPF